MKGGILLRASSGAQIDVVAAVVTGRYEAAGQAAALQEVHAATLWEVLPVRVGLSGSVERLFVDSTAKRLRRKRRLRR